MCRLFCVFPSHCFFWWTLLLSHSPAGSSRYGSSCNVSQESSHLSELEHSHESAHGSEQEDDHQERQSNHSYHSSGSLQKDGQAWLKEQEEPHGKGEKEVCKTEEKPADHSAAKLPLELEKPRDVDAGVQMRYVKLLPSYFQLVQRGFFYLLFPRAILYIVLAAFSDQLSWCC